MLYHRNGYSYFGRGLVQLTHGYNYKRIGQFIGLGDQLYDNPSLVLNTEVSVKILCVGMLIGSFVPRHNLERYFNAIDEDWAGARRMINGTDKKELIKGYALNFLSFIEMTDETEVLTKSMDEQMPTNEELNAEMKDTSQINIYFEVDSKLESANKEDYKHVVLKPEEKENVLHYDEFLEKDVKVKK
ncbi:MAG: Chitinase class I [uncultured Sulfurovum sp.]|uniref:Chitinase class I n=1 Tax=uncultured Sulfurovum sp. TaxID=269237 RepID=A0A6S6U902_9BACT|nr:MAG: Chitinase class I [uncultured Sulfurovum sp.]